MIKLFNESNIGKNIWKTLLKIHRAHLFKTKYVTQYFNYIVVVSFIGEGNRSIRRKPTTCFKLLTNLSHNIVSSTPRHERDSNYHTITTTSTPQCPVSNPAILKGQKEDNVLKPSLSSLSAILWQQPNVKQTTCVCEHLNECRWLVLNSTIKRMAYWIGADSCVLMDYRRSFFNSCIIKERVSSYSTKRRHT